MALFAMLYCKLGLRGGINNKEAELRRDIGEEKTDSWYQGADEAMGWKTMALILSCVTSFKA